MGFNNSYILLNLRKIFENMKTGGWHMQTNDHNSLQLWTESNDLSQECLTASSLILSLENSNYNGINY